MVGENITTNLLVVGQVNTPSNREQSCASTALFFFFLFDHKTEFIHNIVIDMTSRKIANQATC